MDIKTKTFVYPVAADCRIRHSHRRWRRVVLGFVIQLEVRHPRSAMWLPVVRYDTAHGFAHRDRQHADGSSEKTPLPLEDHRQALHYAEAELKAHWQTYRQHFLEEVEHGPRQ